MWMSTPSIRALKDQGLGHRVFLSGLSPIKPLLILLWSSDNRLFPARANTTCMGELSGRQVPLSCRCREGQGVSTDYSNA